VNCWLTGKTFSTLFSILAKWWRFWSLEGADSDSTPANQRDSDHHNISHLSHQNPPCRHTATVRSSDSAEVTIDQIKQGLCRGEERVSDLARVWRDARADTRAGGRSYTTHYRTAAVPISPTVHNPRRWDSSVTDAQPQQQWWAETRFRSTSADPILLYCGDFVELSPFKAYCCHMGTAIKHHVPDRVKPSFVIFDIRALWRSVLSPYGNSRL